MYKKEDIILEFMKDENYTPMKAKEMAMILGVPKKEYNKFLQMLKELEEKLSRLSSFGNINVDELDCNSFLEAIE